MRTPSTPRALTKLRAICLALPDAKETISHGAATFWSPKRTFAMFADASNHHGRGRHAVWLGVWLDDVCDWDELAVILKSAHQVAVEKSRARSKRSARVT